VSAAPGWDVAGGPALPGNCVDRCRHGAHTEGSNSGQWRAGVAVRCLTLEQPSCLACYLHLLECAALLVQHVTHVLRRARRSRVPSWSWSGACGLPHHPCPAAPRPPRPVSDPTCWSCVLPATLSAAAASAACARAPCEWEHHRRRRPQWAKCRSRESAIGCRPIFSSAEVSRVLESSCGVLV